MMNSDSPIQGRIILVGNRKGAVAAAKRCGWDPIEIDVKAHREQSHLAFGGGSDWTLDYVRELFPEGGHLAPLGVVAVTTGSVVAAAAAHPPSSCSRPTATATSRATSSSA